MRYAAKHYVSISGRKYTPGEIIDIPIPEEKLKRLLRLKAIERSAPSATPDPAAANGADGDDGDGGARQQPAALQTWATILTAASSPKAEAALRTKSPPRRRTRKRSPRRKST